MEEDLYFVSVYDLDLDYLVRAKSIDEAEKKVLKAVEEEYGWDYGGPVHVVKVDLTKEIQKAW